MLHSNGYLIFDAGSQGIFDGSHFMNLQLFQFLSTFEIHSFIQLSGNVIIRIISFLFVAWNKSNWIKLLTHSQIKPFILLHVRMVEMLVTGEIHSGDHFD